MTLTITPPKIRKDDLGWVALALLAAPALLGMAWGVYWLVIGDTHQVVHIRPGQPFPTDEVSAQERFELLFLVLWTSGLNVLLGGLITGWVWIHRVRDARWLRDGLLIVAAVIVGAVPMWAWSEVSSRRPEGIVMLFGSAVGLIGTYLILGPRRTTARVNAASRR